MTRDNQGSKRSNFRRFFFRGLAILLPTVLTIWILVAAYGFFRDRIAQPINSGLREVVVRYAEWPEVLEEEVEQAREGLTKEQLGAWKAAGGEENRIWLRLAARRDKLEAWWAQYAVPLDLIGLVIAVFLTYFVGALLGSFIGHRLYYRGEQLFKRLPLVKQIYPSVKQVTDFLVGSEEQKLHFSKVVAVEYPRKGLWSVGLVTGQTMRLIGQSTGVECLTVFVPSSPTPFTGYVITVPKQDTLDLPVTIEEALRFTVSGGVVLPQNQRWDDDDAPSPQDPHPQDHQNRRGARAADQSPQTKAAQPVAMNALNIYTLDGGHTWKLSYRVATSTSPTRSDSTQRIKSRNCPATTTGFRRSRW